MAEKIKKKKKIDIGNILENTFGKGSIFGLEDEGVDRNTQWINTGVNVLNYVLGAGIPKGKIIEIFGPESSGKTTLCLYLIKILQRYGLVLFIDAEHALDVEWARKQGVNLGRDKFLISQPDNGEISFDIITKALRDCKGISGIVIDSAAALVPQAEVDGDMGDRQMGAFPQLMARGLRKIVPLADKSGIPVIFTNQARKVFNVRWGSPIDSPGGLAFKHYATIRIKISRIKTLKKGEESVANLIKILAIKNKVAPPFRQGQLELNFKFGIDDLKDMVNTALEKGVIKVKESKKHEGKQIMVFDKHSLGFYDNDLIRMNRDKINLYIEDIKNKIKGGNNETFV